MHGRIPMRDRAITTIHPQVSAYRLASGHAYPISIRRRVKFDRRHALSFTSFGQCLEICVLIFCFVVSSSMVLLLRSEPLRSEREAAGPTLLFVLAVLTLFTLSIGGVAVARLVRKWLMHSSGVFASEV
mmetsp:Transcript_21743/g.65983  ORF Transcript_21743/g.65983 Transcript_21743/m.65983 type:complete len:129 (+) Transcript_21743:42-428(+)